MLCHTVCLLGYHTKLNVYQGIIYYGTYHWYTRETKSKICNFELYVLLNRMLHVVNRMSRKWLNPFIQNWWTTKPLTSFFSNLTFLT